MDKLVFPNSGGFPLKPENLEFQNNSIESAFKAILKPLLSSTNGMMVVSGLESSAVGNVITIASGWVVLNGELCQFETATVNVSDLPASFVIAETNDPSGLDTLVNNTQFNAHKRRRAVISTTDLTGLPFNELDDFRYFNLVQYGLDNFQNYNTFKPSLENGWNQSPQVENHLRFIKKGKSVLVFGQLLIGNLVVGSATKIGDVPTNFRPLRRIYLICPVLYNMAILLNIEPNGDIFAFPYIGAIIDIQASVLIVNEYRYEVG
jgi:hypothetical protein